MFLDRDGVVTKEKSYVTTLEELEIFPYAKKCIQAIQKAGYYAIIITNQSAVARGILEEETLLCMNQYVIQETGADAIYYCPHHPKAAIPKYRMICHCRKPEIGLIERACQEFPIDLSKSYFIGDRESDILAGQKAGLKTILVESGYGKKSLTYAIPDRIYTNLEEFIKKFEI